MSTANDLTNCTRTTARARGQRARSSQPQLGTECHWFSICCTWTHLDAHVKCFLSRVNSWPLLLSRNWSKCVCWWREGPVGERGELSLRLQSPASAAQTCTGDLSRAICRTPMTRAPLLEMRWILLGTSPKYQRCNSTELSASL